MQARAIGGSAVAFGVLVVGIAVAFAVGRFPVTLPELGIALWSRLTGTPSGLSPSVEAVVFNIRGPRVLAALACGAALAIAGAAFQRLAPSSASSSPSAFSASRQPPLPAACWQLLPFMPWARRSAPATRSSRWC
jgi:iron complex transport system permease protein